MASHLSNLPAISTDWPPENYARNSPAFQKVRQQAMGVKAYSAEEIAQGSKSGQWASLNKKNGATFKPSDASALSASASALATGSSHNAPAVSLENVLPSQRMRTADLGPLKIEYPENWQVIAPKQRGQSFMIAPQAGVTENNVGYGVVLNGVLPLQRERLTIEEVTRRLVQDMEQNEALQQVGDAQPITVGGIEGRSVTLHSFRQSLRPATTLRRSETG